MVRYDAAGQIREMSVTFVITMRSGAFRSTMTGNDSVSIGQMTSFFMEMARNEKPNAFPFWFILMHAARRRKLCEMIVAQEIILMPPPSP